VTVNFTPEPGVRANLHGESSATEIGLQTGMETVPRRGRHNLLLCRAEPDLEAANRDDGQLRSHLDLEFLYPRHWVPRGRVFVLLEHMLDHLYERMVFRFVVIRRLGHAAPDDDFLADPPRSRDLRAILSCRLRADPPPRSRDLLLV